MKKKKTPKGAANYTSTQAWITSGLLGIRNVFVKFGKVRKIPSKRLNCGDKLRLSATYQTSSIMNLGELKKDFLPKEIILKLMLDIPRENYSEKLEILDNYINQVKDSFEQDILLIKSNNQKGFIYWEAEKYNLAIKHYEKVLEILGPSDYPFLYFHIAYMLITCYRLTKQFGPSMQWAETALNNLNCTDSSFGDKLGILTAYTELLEEAGRPFNEKYTEIIDNVIQELEFPPVSAVEPIKRIKKISQEHKKWNQQLMKVDLISRENKGELTTALKDYVASCEIGWYKKYAAQRLKRIENASLDEP